MAESKGNISRRVGVPKSCWIDISIPLHQGMVHWPTDTPPRFERIKDVDKGDQVTLTEMTIISHTGTHIDAPLHFIYQGRTIEEMPLDAVIGRVRVIGIKDNESIKREELEAHRIRRGERILFKTRNSKTVYQTDEFVEDYVFLTAEAARFLVERGVRIIGLDYISVGSIKSESNVRETHETLLRNGVWIIEGLILSAVKTSRYELICLPLKLARGDAAPARAILRRV
jgi:arylformamidase